MIIKILIIIAVFGIIFLVNENYIPNAVAQCPPFCGNSTGSGSGSATPPIPTGFTATSISSTQIRLDWNTSSGATGYKIEQAISGGPWVVATSNTGATASYTISNLQPNTVYYFRISAINAAGIFSNESDQVSISTKQKIEQPPVEIIIPSWIKSTAGYWCQDLIDDSAFIQLIQYLINEQIIIVLNIEENSTTNDNVVPSWIKTNACWWHEGQIEDSTFTLGIENLINQGIIQLE